MEHSTLILPGADKAAGPIAAEPRGGLRVLGYARRSPLWSIASEPEVDAGLCDIGWVLGRRYAPCALD